jgi:hypothetical protein
MRSISVVVIALGVASCGQAPNDLWGSIDESFPLEFDYVVIRKQDLSLIVEYIQELHGGIDKVCKIVVNTGDVDIRLKDGTSLEDEYFADYTVTVERVAATGGDFPDVTSGEIKFDDWNFEENGKMDGSFTAQFENGRNLLGNFDGRVIITSTE